MRKILVICAGNICRSPAGEGILRAELTRAGFEDTIITPNYDIKMIDLHTVMCIDNSKCGNNKYFASSEEV
jgi:predicted protein tyrosine phosphatase